MSEPRDPRPSEEPAEGPADDDVFADLVAHFDEEPDEHDWPAVEDVARRPRLVDPAVSDPAFVGDPRALGYADDPDDEHYVPPPPPRAGWMRPATGFALLAIVLGILVLALPEIVSSMADSPTQEVTGVVLILGGVGVLIARMSDRPSTDDDEGPDNGAVI